VGVVLQEAGWRWQKDSSWCETGKVKRKRKAGVVEVTDPDATLKNMFHVFTLPAQRFL
jgi:hypothetical protein